MEKLTLDHIKAPRPVHYVETLYGFQIGLRRVSARKVMELQRLGEAGGAKDDPIGAYRDIVRASLADPEPSDELLDWLEHDWKAFLDLGKAALHLNGLTPEAQVEAAQTFRESSSGPEGVPSGS